MKAESSAFSLSIKKFNIFPIFLGCIPSLIPALEEINITQ